MPYGGKARYGALEVALEGIGALCLTDFMEGKRGGVHWRSVWKGEARFAYMVLVRESAVGWHAEASGGGLRALPTGFCGGKARSDAVEVHLAGPGALCLKGS